MSTNDSKSSNLDQCVLSTSNRLISQGNDLVKISTHQTDCPLCKPWQGKILSLTGKTPGYPTLEEAKSAGLFHEGCRHAIGLFIDSDIEIMELERELKEDNSHINKRRQIAAIAPKSGFNLPKMFYGPILYFKMKSYFKGALWLLFVLAILPSNFLAALLFWIIAGWLGKRNLERKQDNVSITKPPFPPTNIHKPKRKKSQSPDTVPVLREVPEGPEYGIAGYIDVETTGLSAKKDEIIEFAITLFCYDKNTYNIIGIIDSYCGLREPTIPIPPEASRVNGIYMRDVKGKDLDYERINDLLSRAEFLISHNADFDRKFVRVLFPLVENKDWLCSMNGIDWYGKGFYSKGLQNLLSEHCIHPKLVHRASADVESAIQLLACSNENRENYLSELIKNHTREKLSKKYKPGYYNGKHYTEYVETIKILRREGEEEAAEKLLLKLLDAIELESKSKGLGVAPWYYEQLAIIYRKRKDYLKEVEILERFAKQKHAPGASPPKLLERLEKAKILASKSAIAVSKDK